MSFQSKREALSKKQNDSTDNRIHVSHLMRGSKQVILVHDDEEYKLRITSNNKLILNK